MDDKYVKILFQDKEYLMREAAIAGMTHIICEISADGSAIEFDECYAVIINGRIMRHAKEIGRKEDIIQVVE